MSGKDLWSRRRAAVAAEEKAVETAALEAETARAEADWAELSDAEILAEANLPEPEALMSADEVRAFLKSALPNRLKTRALRRLWTLNPVLANLDGLVDYGEDFTDSALAVETLQTAYQVGRGMLKHVERLARDAEAEHDEATAAEVPTEDASEELVMASEELASDEASDTTPDLQTVAPDTIEDADTPVFDTVPVRRRMAFTFETPAA